MNFNDIRRDDDGKLCETLIMKPKIGREADFPQLITLKGLADPATLEFYSYGTPIIITNFDEYGQPILTKEQYEFCLCQANDLKRRARESATSLKFVVRYLKQKFNVPREEFDSLAAIEAASKNLFALENLLRNRQKFYRVTGEELHEFLLFGYIKLDAEGGITEAETHFGNESAVVVVDKDVVEFDEGFTGEGFGQIDFKENRDLIPKAGSLCPYCGKPITIENVRMRSDIHYHRQCRKQHQNMTDYDDFCEIIYAVYPDYSKHFSTVLESGYRRYHFKTQHGHIAFDSTPGNGQVRIAWFKDYKPFDKSKLGFPVLQEGHYLVTHASDGGTAVQRLRIVKSNIIR